MKARLGWDVQAAVPEVPCCPTTGKKVRAVSPIPPADDSKKGQTHRGFLAMKTCLEIDGSASSCATPAASNYGAIAGSVNTYIVQ